MREKSYTDTVLEILLHLDLILIFVNLIISVLLPLYKYKLNTSLIEQLI